MGKTSDRHCEICNIGFSTELSLKEHRLSLMHHKILNHQLRSQGIVDPEHYCFLCQKSLFFNAWADHLLDRAHRQRVFAMKSEAAGQAAALHALAARSAWNPLLGPGHALPRTASTASLGESRYATAAESFLSSDGSHSDAERRFDRETEALIQRTQALLRRRQVDKAAAAMAQQQEEEEMTPVTSLQATERSDWLPGQQQQQQELCFDATPSQSSSCSSRTRARRRAARKLPRSGHNGAARATPVIEPIVRLNEESASASSSSASASGAFAALLAADRGPQPFQFGRPGGAADFSFRLPDSGLAGPAGGVVARMQEAVRLSKAEEATRAKAGQCEARLEGLNARVEQLLALIAAEEDKREKFRMEEAALHSRRMEIIRSICAPRDLSWGSQEEEEEEEEEEPSLPFGFGSVRSESPLEPLESAVQDLHIGDETCRDILSKVMERRLVIEEEEEEEEESNSLPARASLEGSEDTLRQRSEDRGRPRTPAKGQSVRSGSLRRQRDPCLTAMMKEYLHAEPSSSDVDLDQTPRSVEGDVLGSNCREDMSSSTDLPSTAAEIFPGTINAHNGHAVLDLCVFKGYVYSAGEDCVVRKFSLQSHECLCEYRGHESLVHCLALSDEVKGEDRLYSGGFDCTLLLFNAKTGRQLQRCAVDAAVHALALAWSLLHVGLANGCLLSFSLASRRFHGDPQRLSERPITCLTALPDRGCLLAGAESDGIRVVSRAGQVLRRIAPETGDMLPLAVLLCHGRVLTFHDRQLLCFDLESGDQVAHLELPTRISSLAMTASHLLLGTVTGRVHSVRSCRLLQEANICLQIEDEEASAKVGANNEAPLTMTCLRETLLVGDEKGRIIIRRL